MIDFVVVSVVFVVVSVAFVVFSVAFVVCWMDMDKYENNYFFVHMYNRKFEKENVIVLNNWIQFHLYFHQSENETLKIKYHLDY
jgi:hypothetical protein